VPDAGWACLALLLAGLVYVAWMLAMIRRDARRDLRRNKFY